MEIILISLGIIYIVSVIGCIISFWDDICTGKTGVVPYIVAIFPILNTYTLFHGLKMWIKWGKR